MLVQTEIAQKLQSAFEPQQAEVLLEVISLSYNNLVKVSDFTELKAIVRDLAESQKSMGESQKSMGESLEALGIAQERTSTQLEEMTTVIKELALAQERTEKQVEKLTSATSDIRSEIGGMSRSMSYALENEAYRALPAFLLDKHGIEVTERLIRAPINNEEITFLAAPCATANRFSSSASPNSALTNAAVRSVRRTGSSASWRPRPILCAPPIPMKRSPYCSSLTTRAPSSCAPPQSAALSWCKVSSGSQLVEIIVHHH